MVSVEIRKTSMGYESIKADNHAGDPIICSAVSAIMQGAAGTIMNLKDKPNITKLIIQDGFVEIEVAPLFDEHDQELVDTVFLFAHVSLSQIEKSYPQNIKVILI